VLAVADGRAHQGRRHGGGAAGGDQRADGQSRTGRGGRGEGDGGGQAAGVEEGDLETLRTGAHQLKGSASNVGAVAVSSAAADVERLADATGLDGIETALTRLGDAVGMTWAALGKSPP